jgi:hypothetical protein
LDVRRSREVEKSRLDPWTVGTGGLVDWWTGGLVDWWTGGLVGLERLEVGGWRLEVGCREFERSELWMLEVGGRKFETSELWMLEVASSQIREVGTVDAGGRERREG